MIIFIIDLCQVFVNSDKMGFSISIIFRNIFCLLEKKIFCYSLYIRQIRTRDEHEHYPCGGKKSNVITILISFSHVFSNASLLKHSRHLNNDHLWSNIIHIYAIFYFWQLKMGPLIHVMNYPLGGVSIFQRKYVSIFI